MWPSLGYPRDQAADAGRQGEAKRRLPPVVRHLRPRLLENAGELGFVVLAREIVDVALEKDDASAVLERLRLGISLHIVLADQRADACDLGFGIAAVRENGAGPLGVPLFQIIAPAQIAPPVHGSEEHTSEIQSPPHLLIPLSLLK